MFSYLALPPKHLPWSFWDLDFGFFQILIGSREAAAKKGYGITLRRVFDDGAKYSSIELGQYNYDIRVAKSRFGCTARRFYYSRTTLISSESPAGDSFTCVPKISNKRIIASPIAAPNTTHRNWWR